MKEIQSIQNPYIIELSKLKQRKYQKEKMRFVVEGFHLVEEAYKHNRLLQVLCVEQTDAFQDIDQILVNEQIIDKLSETKTPQNIIGVCSIQESVQISNKVLLLDKVQDPGNVGTLIRSAAAFGVNTVVIGTGSAGVYNDKTIRASQGSIFQVNIIQSDLKPILQKLKETEVPIYGTALEEAIDFTKIKKPSKYALILGNEGQGIDSELLKLCDFLVNIPTVKVESLNVAIAGSILLHAFS